MLIVTGTIEVAAADADKAKAAAAVMALATRGEPGCITYAFWQNVEDAGQFRVYEEWQSQAALDAHGKTPHMAEFRAALAGLTLTNRDIVKFERGPVTPLG